VNTKDDCGGRLFPTITKLKTWGELIGEEGSDRDRGDSDTDDNTIESSFTDHCNSPLDPMSTLPKIFNFDEGFILDPEDTSNLTTGDREARMEILMNFSHLLRSSAEFEEIPLITIWKVSPMTAEVELGVTTTPDREEEEEKIRDGHESRYKGEIWKHLNSKDKGWGLKREFGPKLESKLLDISKNKDLSTLNPNSAPPTKTHIRSPDLMKISTDAEEYLSDLECFTVSVSL
jgi:hypothetical protein